MGGQSDLFKEFSVLFMTVVLLHINPYTMPKGKASLLITEFKGHKMDWAEWIAESILREIVANRRRCHNLKCYNKIRTRNLTIKTPNS